MIRNPVRLTLSLLAALALVALPAASHLAAQGSKGTIKIATQSPLSGGQAALGEGIKLGAQLAIEKWRGNLTKMGYKVLCILISEVNQVACAVERESILGKRTA